MGSESFVVEYFIVFLVICDKMACSDDAALGTRAFIGQYNLAFPPSPPWLNLIR